MGNIGTAAALFNRIWAKMRSVLFGKDGQVGVNFNAPFSFGELIALNRADCDLQDQEAIGNILSRHSPLDRQRGSLYQCR